MRIDVRSDIADIRRRFANVPERVIKPATVRALNRAATTVRSEAVKEIRATYNLPSKNISSAISIIKATHARLVATIRASGPRIPLYAFDGKPSYDSFRILSDGFRGRSKKSKRKPPRITVRVSKSRGRTVVKGSPELKGSPFIARMRTGHVGIFQRKSDERLPIKELFSVDVPSMFAVKRIVNKLEAVGRTRFAVVLRQELKFRTVR